MAALVGYTVLSYLIFSSVSVRSADIILVLCLTTTTTDSIMVDLITQRSSMTLLVDTTVILFVVVASYLTHAQTRTVKNKEEKTRKYYFILRLKGSTECHRDFATPV